MQNDAGGTHCLLYCGNTAAQSNSKIVHWYFRILIKSLLQTVEHHYKTCNVLKTDLKDRHASGQANLFRRPTLESLELFSLYRTATSLLKPERLVNCSNNEILTTATSFYD